MGDHVDVVPLAALGLVTGDSVAEVELKSTAPRESVEDAVLLLKGKVAGSKPRVAQLLMLVVAASNGLNGVAPETVRVNSLHFNDSSVRIIQQRYLHVE